MAFFENGVLPGSFWAVFSSISGTHQIADLAIFFVERGEGFQWDCKTLCERLPPGPAQDFATAFPLGFGCAPASTSTRQE